MSVEEAVRKELEATYDDVMTTEQAVEAYEFQSFLAPFAVVVRRSDNVKGFLSFNHRPRFYFNFTPARRG